MIKLIKKIFGSKSYLSEAGQFLAELKQRYPQKSVSQAAEVAKYQRISHLRDHVVSENKGKKASKIWQQF